MPSARPVARPALAAALAVGLAGDLLLRGAYPGINVVLFIALLAAAARIVAWRGQLRAPDSWLLLAIGFASCLAIRDAEALQVLNILAVLAALAFAGIAARAEARRARIRDYAITAFDTGLQAGLGGFLLLAQDADWSGIRGRGALRRSRPILVGLALALPVVLVFGALFASADPAFEHLGRALTSWNLGPVGPHLLATVGFGWLAAGLLRAWLVGPLIPRLPNLEIKPIGATPVGIVVGAMVLMFLLFVGLQARWLFGGAELVQSVTGLTYAEFARRGFFEMVAASLLALPVLYGAEAMLAGAAPAAVQNIRRLGAVQLGLMALVMLSALGRMRLYTDAYGLTQDRILATAILVWLAAVMVWFANTVLRGRSERFSFGAVSSAFAVLAVLNAANPDAIIARVNTGRALAGRPVDAEHLATLSADATPVLASRLGVLPVDVGCAVSKALAQARWTKPEEWRSWNLARVRARGALRAMPAARPDCAGESLTPH